MVSSYFKSSQTLLQATGIWDQQRNAWFVGSHYSWLYYAILCYTMLYCHLLTPPIPLFEYGRFHTSCPLVEIEGTGLC